MSAVPVETPNAKVQRLMQDFLNYKPRTKFDVALDFFQYYLQLWGQVHSDPTHPAAGLFPVHAPADGPAWMMYHAAVNAKEFLSGKKQIKAFKAKFGEAADPGAILKEIATRLGTGATKARYQAFGDDYAVYDEYGDYTLYDAYGNKYYVDGNYVASGKLARYDDDYYYHYGGDLGNYYGSTTGQRVHRNKYHRRKLQQSVDNGDIMDNSSEIDLDSSLLLGMVLFIGCIALIGLIAVLYRYKGRKHKMQRNYDKVEVQMIGNNDDVNEV